MPVTDFEKQYPKCTGCIHCGSTFPCEYILHTGHSPRSQGVNLADYPRGGCPLKDKGDGQKKRLDPMAGHVPKERRPRGCSIDESRALELYRQGLSDPAIARELGCSRLTVANWRKRRELATKNSRRSSAFDAPEVLAAYHAGASDEDLAQMVGYTSEAARHWRRRRGLPRNDHRGSA